MGNPSDKWYRFFLANLTYREPLPGEINTLISPRNHFDMVYGQADSASWRSDLVGKYRDIAKLKHDARHGLILRVAWPQIPAPRNLFGID